MSDFRCSALSAALDEPVLGTASIVGSWLLLEQPGSWGRDALAESRLPARAARFLGSLEERLGVRPLLIRRPDRTHPPGRHCFLIHSRRPTPWIEHRLLDDPEEVVGIDVAALAEGRRPSFGAGWGRPLFLVCTNGRHDPCCARLGRPVVRELAARHGELVWESSHLGGERFAANLICFPHGLYFGRLDPAGATAATAAYQEGAVDLARYRGRAGDAFVVQAAEGFLRAAHGLMGVDDVAPTGRQRLDAGLWAVEFQLGDGRRFEVHVAAAPAEQARPLTCGGAPRRPPTFVLVDLFPRPGAGPAVH